MLTGDIVVMTVDDFELIVKIELQDVIPDVIDDVEPNSDNVEIGLRLVIDTVVEFDLGEDCSFYKANPNG